jgi:hypothetical protein
VLQGGANAGGVESIERGQPLIECVVLLEKIIERLQAGAVGGSVI